MSAQSSSSHGNVGPWGPTVPRTVNGIADALSGARRLEFFHDIGDAPAGPELDHVMAVWWDRAMHGADPGWERRQGAAGARPAMTLPKVSLEEVVRRKISRRGAAAG